MINVGNALIRLGAFLMGAKYYPGKKNPDFGAIRKIRK